MLLLYGPECLQALVGAIKPIHVLKHYIRVSLSYISRNFMTFKLYPFEQTIFVTMLVFLMLD